MRRGTVPAPEVLFFLVLFRTTDKKAYDRSVPTVTTALLGSFLPTDRVKPKMRQDDLEPRTLHYLPGKYLHFGTALLTNHVHTLYLA